MHPCPRPAYLVFAIGMLFCGTAMAGESAQPMATTQPVASTGMPVFVSNIAPEAIDAVKVVDAFSTAIKQVKLDDAAKLLDPKVLILESGSSERSRDEYLQSHAIADAAFMQTADQQLRYRQAQAEGTIAWVGTESILSRMQDGKPMHLLSTETMILRKGPEGWKIVHIHWSSRPAPKS
ncbi:MAG: nuclear transport factor 2 family protein [Lysobacteraceae bacterium]